MFSYIFFGKKKAKLWKYIYILNKINAGFELENYLINNLIRVLFNMITCAFPKFLYKGFLMMKSWEWKCHIQTKIIDNENPFRFRAKNCARIPPSGSVGMTVCGGGLRSAMGAVGEHRKMRVRTMEVCCSNASCPHYTTKSAHLLASPQRLH